MLKIKKRYQHFNVYIECDEEGNPILKKRSWSNSAEPKEQVYIIRHEKQLKLEL